MSTSEEVRLRGNELYKLGRITEAIQLYDEAHKLSPETYTPLANLAAAYFEVGRYAESNNYAAQALLIAGTSASQASIDRIRIRQIRSYLLLRQVDEASKAREAFNEGLTDELRAVDHFLGASDHTAATIDPYSLPILKPTILPDCEYEVIGIDPPVSLFDSSLLDQGRQDISLLFVEASDLRNVLATIVRYADPAIRRPADNRLRIVIAETRIHMLARQLLILSLIDKVCNESDVARSRLVLETLVYVYVAALMPPKHAHLVTDVIRSLMVSITASTGICTSLLLSSEGREALLITLEKWMHTDIGGLTAKDARLAAARIGSTGGINTIAHLLPPRMRKEVAMFNEHGFLVTDQHAIAEKDDLETFMAGLRLSMAPSADNLAEIDSTWVPNASLLSSTAGSWEIMIQHSPFDLGSQVTESEISAQQDLFSLLTKWFTKVASAYLSARTSMQISHVFGDVTDLFVRCRRGVQPASGHLPRSFDRIHLAAYPDAVGGSLWTYTFAGPLLAERPECFVTWKCLSKNAGFKSWKNYDREYLMFARADGREHKRDVAAIFGLRVDQETYSEDEGSVKFESFGVVGYCRARRVGSAQLNFDELMSQADLTAWLQRIFLKLVLPPPVPIHGHTGIISPLSLNFFFHLIHMLASRGYPAHWLHNNLQSIYRDQLATTARLPCTKPLKSKELLAKHGFAKEDIRPAQLELTTLMSLWSTELPFCFVPEGDPVPRDIAPWRVSFSKVKNPGTPITYAIVVCPAEMRLPVNDKGWQDERANFSIITTLRWDEKDCSAVFWLSEAANREHSARGSVVGLWDSESWICQSEGNSSTTASP